MTKSFALIGCGKIGSRHLQALAKLPYPCEIHVFEPSMTSQGIAKKLYAEALSEPRKELIWHQNINAFQFSKIDIAIVATNSVGRSEIIQTILSKGIKKILIEKIVCQSANEYEAILSALKKSQAQAWVNTSRRYYTFYQVLKTKILNNKSFNMTVIGGHISLGSNALHFIDLFIYLTGNTKIELHGEHLNKIIKENKRGKDFVEFSGTIFGKTQFDQEIRITSLAFKSPTIINIITPELHMVIGEGDNTVIQLRGGLDELPAIVEETVSNSTQVFINEILSDKTPELPKVHDLQQAHIELFKIFNNQLKTITGKSPDLCPIT